MSELLVAGVDLLLFFLEALPRRVGQRLELFESRLALGKRALSFLHALLGDLVDRRRRAPRELHLRLRPPQGRFEPVDLGLPRCDLHLAPVELVAARRRDRGP